MTCKIIYMNFGLKKCFGFFYPLQVKNSFNDIDMELHFNNLDANDINIFPDDLTIPVAIFCICTHDVLPNITVYRRPFHWYVHCGWVSWNGLYRCLLYACPVSSQEVEFYNSSIQNIPLLSKNFRNLYFITKLTNFKIEEKGLVNSLPWCVSGFCIHIDIEIAAYINSIRLVVWWCWRNELWWIRPSCYFEKHL